RAAAAEQDEVQIGVEFDPLHVERKPDVEGGGALREVGERELAARGDLDRRAPSRRLAKSFREAVEDLGLGLELPAGLRVLRRLEDRRHRGDEAAAAREFARLLLAGLDELRLVRIERLAGRVVAGRLLARPAGA